MPRLLNELICPECGSELTALPCPKCEELERAAKKLEKQRQKLLRRKGAIFFLIPLIGLSTIVYLGLDDYGWERVQRDLVRWIRNVQAR